MGFLSDAWEDVKDTASSAWDSTKNAVKDVTGISSMGDILVPGFGVASGMAALQGGGLVGEVMQPLMGQQQMPMGGMPQMSGPLMGSAPASLTMGAGGPAPAQTVNPGAQNIAGLFGPSGYQAQPTQTSAALLQSNPEAYQFQPLMGGMS